MTEAADINNAPATKAGDDSAQAADVGISSAHMTKVGNASAIAANKSNLAAGVGGFHITAVDVARARRQHRTETGSMGTQTGSASIQSGNDVLHHQPFVHPEGQPGNNQGLQGKNSLPHTGCRPLPPSSTRSEGGRNHLNEEITPLLPTGIGERYSQTISYLGRAALLRRCELPL